MPLISIIVTLLIFTIIVVVHEYGHFIAARKNGILVEEFAVGMGPKIIGWQRGDTLYTIRALPIGGYCKMMGMEDDGANDERSFNSKKVWQRMTVIIAGVVMNFLLAVVLAAILISSTVLQTTNIMEVVPGSPAEVAGIMPGDRLVRIDGRRVHSFEYISHHLARSAGEPVDIVVRRSGANQSVNLTPNFENGRFMMGVRLEIKAGLFIGGADNIATAGPLETLRAAWGLSMYSVTLVLDGLSMLVNRQVGIGDLAGPIGVGQVVDTQLQAAAQSPAPVRAAFLFSVNMALLLSANLAVLNLLPLPALDGGRLIFLIIEGVRRKPLPPEKEGWIHMAGFVLVLGLALLVAFNDILRIVS